jgi:hypothetical protein
MTNRHKKKIPKFNASHSPERLRFKKKKRLTKLIVTNSENVQVSNIAGGNVK